MQKRVSLRHSLQLFEREEMKEAIPLKIIRAATIRALRAPCKYKSWAFVHQLLELSSRFPGEVGPELF